MHIFSQLPALWHQRHQPLGAGSHHHEQMTWTIGLLGDVMLGRGVGAKLATLRPAELWSSELRALLSTFDLAIANLECCISGRGFRRGWPMRSRDYGASVSWSLSSPTGDRT